MLFLIIIVVSIFLLTGLFTVRQQTAGIVERFGKFKRIAGAGLNFKIPLIDRVAGRMSFTCSTARRASRNKNQG
jgi:regulator of protease activity HflC (stomatin/prohibitin superfamily)